MPALIFDCDGVLADTERDGHRPAFNQTFAEAGLPEQEADTMQAVFVPAGTPRAVIDLLYHEIKAIVALPDIRGAIQSDAVTLRIFVMRVIGCHLRASRFWPRWPNRPPNRRFDG